MVGECGHAKSTEERIRGGFVSCDVPWARAGQIFFDEGEAGRFRTHLTGLIRDAC